MLFYFIFDFRFFLFFSYLLFSYRTLLITVLFNGTDRLSCINIRVTGAYQMGSCARYYYYYYYLLLRPGGGGRGGGESEGGYDLRGLILGGYF